MISLPINRLGKLRLFRKIQSMAPLRIRWSISLRLVSLSLSKDTSRLKTVPDLALHSENGSSAGAPLHKHTSLSATSRQTLSESVRLAYISRYAAAQGHKAVITCESATKLAARTLGAMATGQGYALGELVALTDVPVLGTDVRIYRPLGSIADDEVKFFAGPKMRGWTSELPEEGSALRKSRKEGIDGLVEGFVRNLEIGFPSTVAVIGRTSGKLGIRSAAKDIARSADLLPCALCGL